jgi:hypothetical protein
MSDGFTKLASSIVTSSIWSADNDTRILWITMLALADADGFVNGSVPGLSAMARIPLDAVRQSLEILQQPDPDSRTKDNEGRRIEPVEGGWVVLNYLAYRDRERANKRKEYLRKYQREYMNRVRHKKSNESLTNVQPSASASASESEGGCKGETEEYAQAYTLARSLMASIATWKPDHIEIQPSRAERTATAWAKDIDKMLRLDKRSQAAVQEVIDWLPLHEGSNGFTWRAQILSGKKLREKFDKLQIEKQQTGGYKCTI